MSLNLRFFLLLFGLLVGQTAIAEKPILRAKALEPGDTIGLVAPARAVSGETIAYVEDHLEEMGYHVKLAPNLTTRFKYLAGEDDFRARSFMDMWRDPEVDALFCLTGGYGATRILDDIDYAYIQEHPKILTGFSDITALHLAIHRQTGLVTFHAPTSQYALANRRDERPFQAESLWGAISAERIRRRGITAGAGIDIYTNDRVTTPMLVVAEGTGTGRLTGGNLSLVAALMGTPYEIETDGRLLFLEDVGEDPYRIDRMLSTLELAGKLEKPAGVILGVFRRCDPEDPEDSFTVDQIFEQYFAHRDYPVISGFPVGHVIENATLPIGVMATLDTNGPSLSTLEAGVSVAPD